MDDMNMMPAHRESKLGPLLIGLVLGIVFGAGGYWWYQRTQPKTTTTTVTTSPISTPTTTSTASGSSTNATGVSNLHSSNEALNLVQSLYSNYLKAPSGRPATPVAKPFLTSSLYAKISAPSSRDEILCAQNTPLSVSYGQPKVTDNAAAVTVTENFGNTTNNVPVTEDVTVTVDLVNLLVNNIQCPAIP